METLLRSKNIQLVHMDRLEYDRNVTLLHTTLDEKNFNRLWNKGQVMAPDDMIALALKEI